MSQSSNPTSSKSVSAFVHQDGRRVRIREPIFKWPSALRRLIPSLSLLIPFMAAAESQLHTAAPTTAVETTQQHGSPGINTGTMVCTASMP